MLLAWYLFVRLGDVPQVRDAVAGGHAGRAASPNYGWWTNIRVTATEIFGGYCLALVVGVLLALLFTWSKTLEALMLPLLVTLEHDPEGGARAADHRLVQVRRVPEHA